ncbi:hypothetical protein Tco_0912837 [Tanacetum coccineum]
MIPAMTPLLGFSGEISWPLGQISLMVTLGDGEHSMSSLMNFMIVRSPSPYNGIIDRLGLKKIQAVPSTAHRMLKFPVEGGIATIRSNTIIPAECRMVAETQNALPLREPTATKGIKVAIHPEYPEQTKPTDMTGVPRSIAEHRLNIREGCQPGGSYQVSGSRNHKRSTLPRLTLKPSHGKETRWQLEDVCGLHRFKQVLPKRLLSPPGNRLESRISLRISLQVFLRYLQGIPPNTYGEGRQGKDRFLH